MERKTKQESTEKRFEEIEKAIALLKKKTKIIERDIEDINEALKKLQK